jgi:hypothetical protein
LTAHFGKKHGLQHILRKKQDWQPILGKNMIGSTFGEKHDWQHILGKKQDWQHILGEKI